MILFSTLAGDKRPLYTRDLLRSCCLPVDESIVFGYGRKWLPESFSPDEKKGVIVFGEVRRKDDLERSKSYLKYHRIRRVVVSSLHKRKGGGQTFTFTLGNFFNYSDKDNEAHRQQLQSWYERRPDAPHSGAARLFVHSAPDLWADQEFFTEGRPESLIEHVSTLFGLGTRHFFFLDRRDEWVDRFAFSQPKISRGGTKRYTWRAGDTCGISLVVFPGQNADFTPPAISVGDDLCSISGPFTEQLEEGFRARFLLTCRRTFDRQAGMLWIRIPSTDSRSSIISPEVQEHIELKPPTLLIYLVISLLAAGSVLPPLAPILAKGFGWPSWASVCVSVVTALFIPSAGYLLVRRIKTS